MPHPSNERNGRVARREMLLRSVGASVGGLVLGACGPLGSRPLLAAGADDASAGTPRPRRAANSCILLWMDGGPSHVDTFDPKPEAAQEYRYAFETIDTDVPGLRVTDGLPKTARLLRHAALLRGMSTPDSNHDTARVLMHTGYKRTAGIQYPPLGAIVSAEKGTPGGVMPNFVIAGVHAYDSVKFPFVGYPGYLGAQHAALVVNHLDRGIENLHSPLAETELRDRLALLAEMEAEFAAASGAASAEAHRTVAGQAVQLMRSEAAQAFDLEREPAASRGKYGAGYFGRGCLLARRLVEVGVPFVEVYLPDWDTHFKTRVDKCHAVSLPQLDAGLSTLVSDLEDRGLLESTLVICMGEFGRSPKINDKGGRDHFSKAWTAALFGGGLRTGQAIGATDAVGGTVVDRPVSVSDFMATVCRALGIDPAKRLLAPGGRPVPIVDAPHDARPVAELFSA